MTATLSRERRGKRRRLFTVGHSYVLRSSRRLPEAIQEASNGEIEVTVGAPAFYRGNPKYGDLRPEALNISPDERVRVIGIPVAFTQRVHFALYGPKLRSLMNSGFDIIHCWEEPFVLSGAQMAYFAPKEALVTFLTWQNISKTYPPPFNWIERRALTRADGWITGGTLCEEVLKGRAVYRERPYRVIGFGIEPKTFRPDAAAGRRVRESLGWGASNEDAPVIGYLGRFREDKGVPLLMRALDGVQKPWRALFVGTGPLEDDIRRWSAPYGSRVQIVPTISNEQVPDYLNAMDMICVPSQTTPTWREQFGRVLIEAFGCEVCVVASDSGEIPHVVADAGEIVPERDQAAWTASIEKLLANGSLRKDLARRGYERVHANFTWPAIGSKYVEFFDHLERSKRSRYALSSAR